MRNILITFFANLIDPHLKTERFVVFNGFSFGRELIKGEIIDLFVNADSLTKELKEIIDSYKNIDKIYCTCSFDIHFSIIKDIIDERWVIGGAVPASFIANKAVPLQFKNQIIGSSLEEYFGSNLSSNFSYYFENFVNEAGKKTVYYACRLGFGCYYNSCVFCDFNQYDSCTNIRPNISKILSQIKPIAGCLSIIHTCINTLPADTLESIFESDVPESVVLHSFIRPDDNVIDFFSKTNKDLRFKYSFTIGAEAFSQTLLNRLNKGIKLPNLLKAVEWILEHNGYIRMTILDNFGFINEKIVEEYIKCLDKLDIISKKYQTKIEINNCSSIVWASENNAKTFSNNVPVLQIQSDDEDYDIVTPRFKHLVIKGSKEYLLNKSISEKYKTINVVKMGKWLYL